MYSSRFAILPGELEQEMNQEQGPFSHATDAVRFLPLADCAQYIPGVGNQGQNSQGIQRHNVDTESVLRRQTTLANKCPPYSVTPWKTHCGKCENCNFGLPCNCKHCADPEAHASVSRKNASGAVVMPPPYAESVPEQRPDCSVNLEPMYTRLDTKKPCNLPGVYINRFEALCEDPQDPKRIHSNSYIGVGTRNFITDMYNKMFNRKCE